MLMETAIALFDGYNLQDPNLLTWKGAEYPAEYFYAVQLHNWVKKLNPRASEAVLLASKAQHIGRWEIQRDQYEEGKVGYLKWRKELAKFHAQTAARLLASAGYTSELIEKVKSIILKKDLRNNTDVQLMENALCLVFLEFQYEGFLLKHTDEKMIGILQKSWAKMTQPGQDEALKLPFTERGKALIVAALKD
ncbi:MAG: DUF4202 domain-containing protein [Sphingobacteriaceae bacterium]